jgi:hypothetical protein
MDNMKHRRLQELDRSDFSIVDGEPDIRGWDVRNSQGRKIGEVEELIVDAQRKKVRYMVVDLDDNELDLDDRKVIIPIGLAELHTKDDDVMLPNIQAEQLRALPEYDEDRLDQTVESKVCSILGRSNENITSKKNDITSSRQDEDAFYKHDYFNDDNLYKNRLHQLKPNQNKDSEFERGLRLWERRSEGGVIPGDTTQDKNYGSGSERNYREKQMQERREMVQNRRNNYEQRRNRDSSHSRSSDDDNRSFKKDNSIERRTRDEGLRDA